jgi:F-box protein 18 (helicase)
MNPTKEQQAVIDCRMGPGEMKKVIAYAGTGKTSTFVSYTRERERLPMLYLAFNKSVEVEAKTKFPGNVTCKTVHALAWSTHGRNYPRLGNNVWHYHVMKRLKVNPYGATLICQTLDNWLNSAEDEFEKKHCAPDFKKCFRDKEGNLVDISNTLIASAKVIWYEMQKGQEPFLMTHSGYLKLFQLSKPRINFKAILLDEAQDTNPVTFDIVNRQREFGSRVLICGDRYQQIYSWRGAVDVMSTTNCEALYLTQSFRFGDNVARVANKLLSTFFGETVPVIGNGKPDALVNQLPPNEAFTIICRTNFEIFNQAVAHAVAGKKIHVIGDQKFSTTFLQSIMDVHLVAIGRNSEVQDRSLKFFRDFKELRQFAEDRADTELLSRIYIVERYKEAIPRLVQQIKNSTVAEMDAHVVLVTAHKSKGLEWDNVVIASDFCDLFDDNGKLVKIKEQVETLPEAEQKLYLEGAIPKDEINLLYVAATRAKKNLCVNAELKHLLSWQPATAQITRPVEAF